MLLVLLIVLIVILSGGSGWGYYRGTGYSATLGGLAGLLLLALLIYLLVGGGY